MEVTIMDSKFSLICPLNRVMSRVMSRVTHQRVDKELRPATNVTRSIIRLEMVARATRGMRVSYMIKIDGGRHESAHATWGDLESDEDGDFWSIFMAVSTHLRCETSTRGAGAVGRETRGGAEQGVIIRILRTALHSL